MPDIKSSADLARWIRGANPPAEEAYALATVMAIAPVTVAFDGEIDDTGVAITTPMTMKYLKSYTPTVNDRVIMLRVGKSWVIVGAIA